MDDISFAFQNGPQLIKSLSMSIRKGEVLALVGPSGSGKSTIFRILSGLLEPQKGTIYWNGIEATAIDRLGRVSYMPQQPQLLPWRTAVENAAISMEVAGFAPKKALAYAESQLHLFGLEDAGHLYPDQLSGGMKQRVSLLRAMLHPAPLLLMDEPFSSLDSLNRIRMHEWLLEIWQREQKTVLLITHDVDEAILLADRILLIAESPMTSLKHYDVPIPRPRQIGDSFDSSFMALKRQIWLALGMRISSNLQEVRGQP